MESGIDLIAKERRRQIEQHGFNAPHDDAHTLEELALAAIHYGIPDVYYRRVYGPCFFPANWDYRWNQRGKGTRIEDLAKAGALIAAEIDRLLRAEKALKHNQDAIVAAQLSPDPL